MKIRLKVRDRKLARNPAVKRWLRKVERILTRHMKQTHPSLFR